MIECAKKTLDERGYGMASAPLMCGQQDIHKALEEELAAFHGTEKAVIFPSGYQANLGFFATMFTSEDIIISDQYNHASIVDGIKLCKAKKTIYRHHNLKDLEKKLKASQNFRQRCVVTEGVFSMEATIVDLKPIVALCKKYKAVLYLDDCHGVAVIGKNGRGTPDYRGVPMSDIDAYIATMGKGLSGGGGGYITGSYGVVTWLKQRSRTYIFSNAICPPIINCARLAIKMFMNNPGLFEEHRLKSIRFREGCEKAGFVVMGNRDCAICPVVIRDELMCRAIELELLQRGIYVIAVGYPVTDLGTARMRCIITVGHTNEMIDKAVRLIKEVATEKGFFEMIKTYD
jgi:glycine C-acetyltransferase